MSAVPAPTAPSPIDHLSAGVRDAVCRHGMDALRISLGVTFLLFGALKFVPGLSPAEPLVTRTLHALSLGLVGHGPAMVLTAAVETAIGITLTTGRFLRAGVALLALAFVGILSPLVLFAGDLVLRHGPTLEAQYVFKDIVLVAAGFAVAGQAVGARIVAAPARDTTPAVVRVAARHARPASHAWRAGATSRARHGRSS
ncbi:MAG: DoxX family protein [Kineosporiaceae bacterium]